jgi:centromeric protein E
VYHPDTTNKQVYDSLVKDIVDSAMQGVNGTVFAYGQTSSGKVNSRELIFCKVDEFPCLDAHHDREYIRTWSHSSWIAACICSYQKCNFSCFFFEMLNVLLFSQTEDREFLLRVSIMEIYNEEVRDLLHPEHKDLSLQLDQQVMFLLLKLQTF